jgi:hypothetical protein
MDLRQPAPNRIQRRCRPRAVSTLLRKPALRATASVEPARVRQRKRPDGANCRKKFRTNPRNLSRQSDFGPASGRARAPTPNVQTLDHSRDPSRDRRPDLLATLGPTPSRHPDPPARPTCRRRRRRGRLNALGPAPRYARRWIDLLDRSPDALRAIRARCMAACSTGRRPGRMPSPPGHPPPIARPAVAAATPVVSTRSGRKLPPSRFRLPTLGRTIIGPRYVGPAPGRVPPGAAGTRPVHLPGDRQASAPHASRFADRDRKRSSLTAQFADVTPRPSAAFSAALRHPGSAQFRFGGLHRHASELTSQPAARAPSVAPAPSRAGHPWPRRGLAGAHYIASHPRRPRSVADHCRPPRPWGGRPSVAFNQAPLVGSVCPGHPRRRTAGAVCPALPEPRTRPAPPAPGRRRSRGLA